MNKRIVISVTTIAAVAAVVVGGTKAFFSDTETSNGNIFTAGSIDLKVDHTYASYDGQECVGNCVEEGENLVTNGGFETPVPVDNGGQWQVYPTSISGWNVDSGAGIEIQRGGVAGAPHGDVQLAELDSHGADSKSAISQIINTVPGQQYRLTFWHSPRPSNNSGDNAITYKVEVTSTNGVMISDTVEVASAGGGTTAWTSTTYNFIALDTQTTVKFSDTGIDQDTLGGYLDDVSVKALNCTPFEYTNGGTCTLWGEKDLTQGDVFWNFTDVKPGDYGTNVISLHVYDNDAYACLLPAHVQDLENDIVDPEVTAGDGPTTGPAPGYGELSGELQFFVWNDKNNNGIFDAPAEDVLVNAGTPMNALNTAIPLALSSPAPIDFIGFTWCAGDQTGPTTVSDTPAVACDGNGMGNIAQTDKVISDFVAYAVQQRNNEDFTCSQVELEP